MKQLMSVLMMATLTLGLVACGSKAPAATQADASAPAESQATADAPKPGDAGFLELPIGEAQIVGPFQVEAVYFQGVDMVPEGKQPTADESDMHLEADIHLTPDGGKLYGFGDGEDIWPAYLTVNYKIMSEDGNTEVASGTMMPMNADDGAHYGINIKKGVLPVGRYKLVLEIKPSEDYLLHVDAETGVPIAQDSGAAAAESYYEKRTVTFDWDYDASQLNIK